MQVQSEMSALRAQKQALERYEKGNILFLFVALRISDSEFGYHYRKRE
jgi:hypothetical protein